MYYYDHRALLEDSLKTEIHCTNITDLMIYLKESTAGTVRNIHIEFYSYDDRIKLDRYMVTAEVDYGKGFNRCPMGFIHEQPDSNNVNHWNPSANHAS